MPHYGNATVKHGTLKETEKVQAFIKVPMEAKTG